MRLWILTVAFALSGSLLAYDSKIPPEYEKLVWIDENHAEIDRDGVTYLLDSYIFLFQQPYYITVERKDGGVVDEDIAVEIAIPYILPRGCTSPLERRPSLDRANSKATVRIIGVAC